MAAGWESLNPAAQLLSTISPELRSAYVGTWTEHRSRFRYALLAELPYTAALLVEDVGTEFDISVLLVDETKT